jgi:Phosphotransferase enzyme family
VPTLGTHTESFPIDVGPDRGSAHATHREQLVVISDTEGLCATLWRATGRRWLDPRRGWRRTVGRFEPSADVFAHLVLETPPPYQEIVVVAISHTARNDGGGDGAAVPGAGWARLSRLDDDRALPTLAAVRSDIGPHEVMRYRPGRRCTIRVDDPHETRWVKVFADDRGASIFRDQEALAREHRRGALAMAVAEPILLDADRRAVWLGNVPGSPVVHRLLGPGGERLASRMGRSLASIAGSGIAPQRDLTAEHLLRRSIRNAADISSRVPELSGSVERLLAHLHRAHENASGRAHRPIHGAPHPNQWLEHGDTLGLVDFDGLALGDPELDVATFQAEVDFETGSERARVGVNTAFQAGYESIAGPLDATLLAAYRAHKRLAKVLRTARAIRPDGDVRAARHLAVALDTFEAARRA